MKSPYIAGVSLELGDKGAIGGPLLAKVYRCYSTYRFLEASPKKSKIWSKNSYSWKFY